MRILIVGSYFETPLKKLWPKLGRFDRIIAVDGGLAELAKLGIVADVAIGDWDSLPPRARARLLNGVRHLTLPKDKDRSDLYYALQLASGATEVTCIGVTGGRPDQHLASLFDLTEFAENSTQVEARDLEFRYQWVSASKKRLRLRRGESISVFAMNGEAKGVTLSGFKYGLSSESLHPSSRGLSNNAKGGRAEIRVKKGTLLILTRAEVARMQKK